MARLVKARFDYNSGHEDDLSFSIGQIITVTEEVDEEWYTGEYVDDNGNVCQGMFPRTFVVAVPSQRTDASTRSTKQGNTPVSTDPKTTTELSKGSGIGLSSKMSAPPSVILSTKPATSPMDIKPDTETRQFRPLQKSTAQSSPNVNTGYRILCPNF